MTVPTRARTSALVLTLALGALPLAATAQDVTYRTRSTVDMGGAMNAVMNIAQRFGGGGDAMDQVETTYIKGGRMRTDSGEESSSIMDMENTRVIVLNHADRTYMSFDFAAMMENAAAMSGEVQRSAEEARSEQADAEGPRTDLAYEVSVDPTGETEEISGYRAERVILTIETEYETTAEGEQTQSGRMVMLSDMWVSEDVPWLDALEGMAGSEAMRENASQFGGSMAAVFASNPERRQAFEAAAAEMAKIEGAPLRTVTSMFVVPVDQEFDREAALREGGDEEEADQGGSAADRMRSLAGGLLGRGNREREAGDEQPTQFRLFRVVEEVESVEVGNLPFSLFEVPEGYREVSAPGGGGGR